MPVILSSRLRSRRLRLPRLHALAENILLASGSAHADLSLLLVGDRSMRRLNRLYRRKDRTTDVLAFPIAPTLPSPLRGETPTPSLPHKWGGRKGGGAPRAPRPAPALLGDVVVSLPQAARQAKQAGHTLEHELAVLVIHGLLHLLGYDHERNAREARRMQRKERAVLKLIASRR